MQKVESSILFVSTRSGYRRVLAFIVLFTCFIGYQDNVDFYFSLLLPSLLPSFLFGYPDDPFFGFLFYQPLWQQIII